MATRLISVSVCSAPMIVSTPNHASTRGLSSRCVVAMCSKNHISVDLRTRSSDHKNKVFEDRSAGIVCYRDENGEITCEGYDEGPRFHHKLSTFHYYNSRDVGIIPLLQRCRLQVADES